MANFSNDWQGSLRRANEALKSVGGMIVITDDEGFYKADLFKVKDGKQEFIETYAENYYEHELEGLVNDAYEALKDILVGKKVYVLTSVYLVPNDELTGFTYVEAFNTREEAETEMRKLLEEEKGSSGEGGFEYEVKEPGGCFGDISLSHGDEKILFKIHETTLKGLAL